MIANRNTGTPPLREVVLPVLTGTPPEPNRKLDRPESRTQPRTVKRALTGAASTATRLPVAWSCNATTSAIQPLSASLELETAVIAKEVIGTLAYAHHRYTSEVAWTPADSLSAVPVF